MDEKRYTHEDLSNVVNVATLIQRMNSLEERYKTHMDALATHISQEERDAAATRDSLDRLSNAIKEKDGSLHACKDTLKKEINDTYVTRSELDLRLERTERRIIDAVNTEVNKLSEAVRDNRNLFDKYKNTIFGVIIAISSFGGFTSWALSQYSTAEQITTASREDRVVMQNILTELKARHPNQ